MTYKYSEDHLIEQTAIDLLYFKRIEIKEYSYNILDITFLRRGVIGVNKVGYF